MIDNNNLMIKAAQLIDVARRQGLRLATVESCTGGLIAATLTEIAGCSDVMEGGFVTYANRAKMDFVKIPESLLTQYGAVSNQIAIAMAEGGLRCSHADKVIAVTGIAGPDGGSKEKPVGLVHFAVATRNSSTQIVPTQSRMVQFDCLGRQQVRHEAVNFALDFLLECCRPSL